MPVDKEVDFNEPVEILPPKVPTIAPTATELPTMAPSPTETAQSVSSLMDQGPQLEDFTSGINPLTGQLVDDPALLDLPAIMVSIPMFPASSRPQAGLSFAPWVFELYIGEGMTRLLATFYGEIPQIEPFEKGSCSAIAHPVLPVEILLGNRAWSDLDQDGIQDPGEPGIGGICVTLYDTVGETLQTTVTDSNGYYGFSIPEPSMYRVGFEQLEGLEFTRMDIGMDDLDSDVDPATGLTGWINFSGSDLNADAGYFQPAQSAVTGSDSSSNSGEEGNSSALALAKVGPVRSMRLSYGTIGRYFQGGCIISASGDPKVLTQVPGCLYVHGDDSSVNGAMLDITKLRSLAEQNKNPNYPVNYSGNLFSEQIPAGGLPASQVNVAWNYGNETHFLYNVLSGDYQRFTNLPTSVDEYIPQTDRLTGRQLLYGDVIVMFVEHKAYAETLIDLDLGFGEMGRAVLFRNGQMFNIHWSTIAQEYEKTTQRLRPIRFTDAAGKPFPLKPGHVWVNVFTTASVVYEKAAGSGTWTAEFHAPLH